MKQVLFVCLGNICRSPSAEAVFTAMIEKHGMAGQVCCDSAGTAAYHEGERADYRMRQFARKRGYDLTSISRPVRPKVDFEQFDYIVGMDRQNVRDLKTMTRNEGDQKKISLMTDYCREKKYNSVSDPYYGGDEGFELVLDILEDACAGLLEHIQKDL